MASARNYWTDEKLQRDAEVNRSIEAYSRGKAELDPYYWLRKANTAKLRAEASEAILVRRHHGRAMLFNVRVWAPGIGWRLIAVIATSETGARTCAGYFGVVATCSLNAL